MNDSILRQLSAETVVAGRHLDLAVQERDILGRAIDALIAAHASESTLQAIDALHERVCDQVEEARVACEVADARRRARLHELQDALIAASPDDELAWLR